MNRQQFEHVIAAAANVVDVDEFVVIGSQAVLGTVPVAPPSMLISMEADVYPLREPDRAIEIDAALGDGSPFQRTYGYYAHGVGPATAKFPRGWLGANPRLTPSSRRSGADSEQPLPAPELVWPKTLTALRRMALRGDTSDDRARKLPLTSHELIATGSQRRVCDRRWRDDCRWRAARCRAWMARTARPKVPSDRPQLRLDHWKGRTPARCSLARPRSPL